MEEVDSIIFINLKSMGLDLSEDEQENVSLASLRADQVYRICLTCLRLIDEKLIKNFPSSLPRAMSAKVNACSEIAGSIKRLGFKGDLSYHQIVYPSANELRHLLMWLIDTIPKPERHSQGAESVTSLDSLMSKELESILRTSWSNDNIKWKKLPMEHHFVSTTRLTYPSRGRRVKQTPGLEKYYMKFLRYLSEQLISRHQLAPSIFEQNLLSVTEQKERDNEWNTKGLGSRLNPMAYSKRKSETIAKMMAGILKTAMLSVSREPSALTENDRGSQSRAWGQFGRKRDFTTKEDLNISEVVRLSEEELQKKREAEIEKLREELEALKASKEEFTTSIQTMTASIRQIEALIHEEENKTQSLEKEYLLKKKTFDLLPEADRNIQQLQEICAQSSSRLLELAQEWEKHRLQLIAQYRQLRNRLMNVQDESRAKLNEIKEIRSKIKEIAAEIHSKEERNRELLEAYGSIQNTVLRPHYTTRILDIVKSVKKQKVDIDKILIDTRNLQKEINSITDTLNRTFAVTDEMIFQDAKKDLTAKEAYKLLVSMNETFKKLIKEVEEVGSSRNAIMNLQAKLESAQERTNSLNLEQIGKDLKEIKSENKALAEKLRLSHLT